MIARALGVAAVVAACASPGDGDVSGPFTGPVHRYVVDAITLPASSEQAHQLGDDLDGDGTIDNQLGVIFAALTSTHDASTHGADMIASGALASSVEIQAASLERDDHVGVRFVGRDGAAATAIGGKLVAGTFASNKSATTHHPGAATIVLPIFADADPLELDLELAELAFAPDGAGGLTAVVRGGIPIDNARHAAMIGLAQMIDDNPAPHLAFARSLDTDRDGTISSDELANSSLLGAFLVADLHATAMLSVGFGVHLVPCDSGRCLASAPVDRCHDRAIDGDETDVDCGGGCGTCRSGASCRVGGDCQSGACDGGRCRAPSCRDGVRDGLESDVDCGDIVGCSKCQLGQVCASGPDCASTHCSASIGTTGTCTP